MGLKFSSFSIRGIDVSQFNGAIDWSKVSCHFAAIRAGYGRVVDKEFKKNWAAAKGKVKRMPYWYLDWYSNHYLKNSTVYGMSDQAWGREQADRMWELIKDDPEGIVWLDLENPGVKGVPDITKAKKYWHASSRAFIERINELNGKKNGLYESLGLLKHNSSWLKAQPLWVAWYNEVKTIVNVLANVLAAGWTGICLMWQYARDGDINDDGNPDGIAMGMKSKFLDLNAWIGAFQDFIKMFGKTETTPEDETPVVVPVPEPEPSGATNWVIDHWSGLYVRLLPNATSEKTGWLPNKTLVRISEIQNGWAALDGQAGYINIKYAKRV